MTNWGLAAVLLAGEGILLPQTIKAFSVESRLAQRGDDITKGRAGFETAVLSKLADIYEEAERVKRTGESLRDALTGSDFSKELPALADLAPQIRRPAKAETRLKWTTYLLAALMTCGHISAPLFSLDNIRGSSFLPEPWDGIAAVVFIVAVVSALVTAFALWRADAGFENAIRDGKAADG